ncbi:acetyl-CoA synthetase-like protein [Daedalea quercina L-15889]|uniref:Acetyl-CoA synthetase-like protein n=1 Tax=Daedalea quercina L-15889 TaxID=1314783 RepID=A0A165QVY6_9APHY|nr:acetyl-CoA synthetase-like protein [Daedalea quercina L-15889]
MASLDIALPPLDGSLRVLPGFVDFHATHNPSRPLYVFPHPDPDSDALRTTSHLEFAQATHCVAHALRPGRSGPEGSVVAIVANLDALLYHAILVGLVRAGCVPFPMSPRNSAPAIAGMMERTRCHRVVAPPAFAALIAGVRGALPSGYAVQVDAPPALSSVFPSLAPSPDRAPAPEPESYPPPPHEPAPTATAFYLHSSGSTGHPKPVPQTHAFVLQWCRMPTVLDGRAHRLRWGGAALPAFHTMGIAVQLLAPLVSGCPTSLFPPRAPPVLPTPESTIENARRTRCNAVMSVPAFLEAWANNDEDVEYLRSLEFLMFAGGPLSKVNGDKLVAHGVRLSAGYGTTEVGTVTANPQLGVEVLDPAGKTFADWEWMAPADGTKVRWADQGDGTYELQMLSCPTHRPAVENLHLPSGERGYSTSDLWIKHPTKPGLWKIVGRNDDVIVLGSGEKTVPIPLEAHIGAHPRVRGVVAFGRGHQQVGVLVEPEPAHAVDPADGAAVAEFRAAIWPRVEEANRSVAAFSRVFKEMILVTDPSRPLPRAGKGTVQRKKVLDLYAEDIENFLSATFLRNRIIGALRASPDSAVQATAREVPQNLVFQHPTLVSLARAVEAFVRADESLARSPAEDIEAMVKKYTVVLPARAPEASAVDDSDGERVVLLTGTTGNLGAHVLALLLEDGRAKRVYALNRGSGLVHRQRAAFDAAQLPVELVSDSKLTLLSVDFAQESFNLPRDVVDEIQRTVTHVVHIAWRVDFNLALTSFETQIASAVRLLTMAPTAHYLFTSSVSVAGGWNLHERLRGAHVPEAALHDASVAAVTSGYGMSKYVVEEATYLTQVLADARRRGFRTTSVRIGQISGSSRSGAWNASEWLPSIVKSSLALGAFPDSASAVSWVPMDAVARTVVDVLLGRAAPELINVVHPRPIKWADVSGAMQAELGVALPSIAFDAWVRRLEAVVENASASDLERIPGVKLVEYFRALVSSEDRAVEDFEAGGLPLFETGGACRVSKTLAGLPPLSGQDARAWVRYWKNIGFLS